MDVIAVVTGASRGAEKGIAIALGETGADRICQGPQRRGRRLSLWRHVGETADLITRAGGKGVAVTLDHTDDEAVAGLFARLKGEHGRLDILVNNAANAAASTTTPGGFWEKPLAAVDLITVDLRSHFVSAYYAAPLLIANGRGLIAHTGHYGAVAYYRGPVYGAQKAGADKMAADFAKEFRPHNTAVVSIWMGGLDTERARACLASMPDEFRPKTKPESPQFTGKVIAALYEANLRMELSGSALIGAELGAKRGVMDIDGSAPKSDRYELGGPPELHRTLIS